MLSLISRIACNTEAMSLSSRALPKDDDENWKSRGARRIGKKYMYIYRVRPKTRKKILYQTKSKKKDLCVQGRKIPKPEQRRKSLPLHPSPHPFANSRALRIPVSVAALSSESCFFYIFIIIIIDNCLFFIFFYFFNFYPCPIWTLLGSWPTRKNPIDLFIVHLFQFWRIIKTSCCEHGTPTKL